MEFFKIYTKNCVLSKVMGRGWKYLEERNTKSLNFLEGTVGRYMDIKVDSDGGS